ncbi:MAG TPA: IPT/TIG domain-containing protein, partial [Candidatus Thermoplasmatota archaeon]|nr:IPT/TIG domain-containing protein [Candidatus Thermoplasmatota archaeon]
MRSKAPLRSARAVALAFVLLLTLPGLGPLVETAAAQAGGSALKARVTGLVPTSGPVGTEVAITGEGLEEATSVTFGGAALKFRVAPDGKLLATVPKGASSSTFVLETSSGRVESPRFVVTGPAPTIRSFSPQVAYPGSLLTVAATGLTEDATLCLVTKFRCISLGAVAEPSRGQLTARLPDGLGAGSYVLRLETSAGSATTSTLTPSSLRVPANAVSFTATPSPASAGATVTLQGAGLGRATAVHFNGQSASFAASGADELKATIPEGATTGPLTVTLSGGTAYLPTAFKITPPSPTITGFSPRNVAIGSTTAATPRITIEGRNFEEGMQVCFQRDSSPCVKATRVSATPTQATAVLPIDLPNGDYRVSVTTSTGTATTDGLDPSRFSVWQPVAIDRVTPQFVLNHGTFLIHGRSFVDVVGVFFHAVTGPGLAFSVDSPTQITVIAQPNPIKESHIAIHPLDVIVVTRDLGTATAGSAIHVTHPPLEILSLTPSEGKPGDAFVITVGNATGLHTTICLEPRDKVGECQQVPHFPSPVEGAQGVYDFTVAPPPGFAPGEYVVRVTDRQNSVDTAALGQAGTYTVLPNAPRITGFTPTSGPGRTAITITGENLGTTLMVSAKTESFPYFVPIPGHVVKDDNTVEVRAPFGVPAGDYVLRVTTLGGEDDTSDLTPGAFTIPEGGFVTAVPAPTITSIEPMQGAPGDWFTIYGGPFRSPAIVCLQRGDVCTP